MFMVRPKRWWFFLAYALTVLMLDSTSAAAQASKEVIVVNPTTQPVPTAAQGTTQVQGSVNISNTPNAPVPVQVVAQPADGFKFVGLSAESFQGDGGVLRMNRACHAVFPGSRMCSTVELFETVNPPDPAVEAWVQPVPAGFFVYNTPWTADKIIQLATDHSRSNCGGWSSASIDSVGPVVRQNGNFRYATCSESHRVACCSP